MSETRELTHTETLGVLKIKNIVATQKDDLLNAARVFAQCLEQVAAKIRSEVEQGDLTALGKTHGLNFYQRQDERLSVKAVELQSIVDLISHFDK